MPWRQNYVENAHIVTYDVSQIDIVAPWNVARLREYVITSWLIISDWAFNLNDNIAEMWRR